MADIMTPEHPRWKEFTERLSGPEGCNFRKDDAGEFRWDCDNGITRPKASTILADMGADVEGSLKYFEEHGGYCDCEIVFNVNPRPPRRRRKNPLRRNRCGSPAETLEIDDETSRKLSAEAKAIAQDNEEAIRRFVEQLPPLPVPSSNSLPAVGPDPRITPQLVEAAAEFRRAAKLSQETALAEQSELNAVMIGLCASPTILGNSGLLLASAMQRGYTMEQAQIMVLSNMVHLGMHLQRMLDKQDKVQ